MDSHDLFIFKHVADSHSISQTAEQLGYVQPNISQRVKLLEEELGVKLFIRNNRGVTITKDGEILLDYANRILSLMDEAKIKVNPEKWQEQLVIGATQTVSALRIPRILSSFLHEHSEIRVKVRTGTSSKLLEQVTYGDIDGAFVTGVYDSRELLTIYTIPEKVSLISPKSVPYDRLETPTLLVNSHSHCVYRNALIQFAETKGLSKPRIIEFDSLEAILQSVRNGLGMSLVPSDVAHLNENAYFIAELPEPIHIHFVVKNKTQQPNGLKSFLRSIKGDSLIE